MVCRQPINVRELVSRPSSPWGPLRFGKEAPRAKGVVLTPCNSDDPVVGLQGFDPGMTKILPHADGEGPAGLENVVHA